MSDRPPTPEGTPAWRIILPVAVMCIILLIGFWADDLDVPVERELEQTRPRLTLHPSPSETEERQQESEAVRGRVVRRGARVMRVWPEETPIRRPPGRQTGRTGRSCSSGGPRRHAVASRSGDGKDGDYVPVGGPPDMTLEPPRMVLRSDSVGRDKGDVEGDPDGGSNVRAEVSRRISTKEKDVWWK